MKCNCEDCRIRSRKRRDYRQSAGTPADEIPRPQSRRRKRRRIHVKGCEHAWVATGRFRAGRRYYTIYACATCGKSKWNMPWPPLWTAPRPSDDGGTETDATRGY